MGENKPQNTDLSEPAGSNREEPGIKSENVSIPAGIRPVGVFYSETPFTALSPTALISSPHYPAFVFAVLLLSTCWYCFQIGTLTCKLTP